MNTYKGLKRPQYVLFLGEEERLVNTYKGLKLRLGTAQGIDPYMFGEYL